MNHHNLSPPLLSNNNHPSAHQHAAAEPRLLPDMKLALSSLYSLSSFNQQQQQHLPTQQAANDFLIHLQSRNIRRKLQSLQQRRQDQQISNKQQHDDIAAAKNDARFLQVSIEMGSSWLACLYVLCSQAETATAQEERLFCAQTLLHRLRRAKLIEAVDWEIEQQPNDDVHSYNQVLHQLYSNQGLTNLAATYKDWMLTINPFIGSVLLSNNCAYDPSQATALSLEDQERIIKGELSLSTLAALVYSTACNCTTMDTATRSTSAAPSSSLPPLLCTLASAMATLVLRLLYSPTTIMQQQQDHEQRRPTIVATVSRALTAVYETAMATNIASSSSHFVAFSIALNACLAAIPDTLLGSPGGARGRLSMDPRCVRAATHELRNSLATGFLWQTLQQQQQQQHVVSTWQHKDGPSSLLPLWSLKTVHAWAKFLPLPAELVQQTIPLVNVYLHTNKQDGTSTRSSRQHVALTYLMAVCEGGAWSLDDVLSYSLGLSEQQLPQPSGKKRQSSKSKKRQKELIETNTTESLLEQAHAEVFQRGKVACLAVSLAWEGLNALTREELGRVASEDEVTTQVDGEGPIGCLAAAANACLPHIVRDYPNTITTTTLPHHAHDLFRAIVSTFQEICASPNREVRGLSFEPLYTLHAALLDTVHTHDPLDEGFESLIVDFFFKCSMSLAAAVSYPLHYFDDLEASSDEVIEIERNDVRDLLRTVAGSGEGGSTSCGQSTHEPVIFALKLLSKLLHSCENVVSVANQQRQLVQEAAVHLFSSLAKPLNSLAASSASHDADIAKKEVLVLALRTLLQIGENVTCAFDQLSLPVNALLPVSRTANIATASLAPMISRLCVSDIVDVAMQDLVIQVLNVSVQVAAHSIARLPELAAQSILCHSQYDIRGAMRGPGGEDHVGVLALMRLAYESDSLARLFVKVLGQFIPTLCELHQQLKLIELERGQGVVHGRGVTPKSRRILLNVLCRLEFMSEGQGGASDMLIALFDSAVEAIAFLKDSSSLGEKELFQMCEAAFDLGCFSPPIVRSLFIARADTESMQRTSCLEALTNACIHGYGYLRLSTNSQPRDKLSLQWNRLRVALFFLLRNSGDADLAERAAEMIQILVRVECEAIHQQCLAGPSSKSSIFCDEIVSADGIPSGIFVRVVGDVIREARARRLPLESVHSCVKALFVSREHVLSSILLECSDPLTGSFADPRPTLCEAWLFSMSEIIDTIKGKTIDPFTNSLLTDSCVAAISLLFYPKLGRTLRERMNDPGMSFDGPQSLALTDFLAHFFALGAGMLEAVALVLTHRVPIDIASLNGRSGDPCILGASIIGAALFRAAQGGLPPWAVESIPEVYSALYFASGRDPATFGLILLMAMDVRLSSTATVLGGVRPGELLSGRFFESMCETTKEGFIKQSLDLCGNDNASSWRRLKVLIKQLCGGKKKETDFKQKPSTTKWDFERI